MQGQSPWNSSCLIPFNLEGYNEFRMCSNITVNTQDFQCPKLPEIIYLQLQENESQWIKPSQEMQLRMPLCWMDPLCFVLFSALQLFYRWYILCWREAAGWSNPARENTRDVSRGGGKAIHQTLLWKSESCLLLCVGEIHQGSVWCSQLRSSDASQKSAWTISFNWKALSGSLGLKSLACPELIIVPTETGAQL